MTVRFTGELAMARGESGRWVECPFDAKEVFGQARPPVVGTVNGTPVRSRLSVYGGTTYLGLTKVIRDAAGLDVGSTVEVVLALDDAPREVEVPAELATALAADETATAAYERLSFTHRKEYAVWVAEAKQEATRTRRAAKAVGMLRDGARHP
jgi:Bacteriocin-protection, YdeI or OmpD-Associated/Domain of unknown function (DUF1905)